MTDPVELLVAANPVPECEPPTIDALWAWLEHEPEREASATLPQAHRRFGLGNVFALALAVLALVVGAGAIVLLHGGQRPRVTITGLPPIPAGISQQRALVDILGVLRRPQTKGDLALPLIGQLEHGTMLIGSPVRSLVRRATTPWGAQVYLIPMRRPTAQMIARWAAQVQPKSAREKILREREAAFARRPPFEGLALFGAGGGCCASAAEIEAGKDWQTSGPNPNVLVMVVPDGVAKVRFLSPIGATRAGSGPVTVAVHDNVAALRSQTALEGPGRFTWYGPSGNVIKPRPFALTPRLTSRPLHLPRLGPGGRCPVSSGSAVANSSFNGVALGSGPVKVLLSDRGDIRRGQVRLGTSGGHGWFAMQTLWFATHAYRGPFAVRAARIGTQGPIEVRPDGSGLGPGSGPLVVPAGPTPNSQGGYRTVPGSTWVKSPGCYAWQVDGRGFSEVIVVNVALG